MDKGAKKSAPEVHFQAFFTESQVFFLQKKYPLQQEVLSFQLFPKNKIKTSPLQTFSPYSLRSVHILYWNLFLNI